MIFEEIIVKVWNPNEMVFSKDLLKEMSLGNIMTKIDYIEQFKLYQTHLDEYIMYSLIIARKYQQNAEPKKANTYFEKFRISIEIRVDNRTSQNHPSDNKNVAGMGLSYGNLQKPF